MTYKQKVRYFIKKVKYYQKKLGLLNWEIHVFKDKDQKSIGYCSWNKDNRVASIYFSDKWIKRKQTSKIDLKRTSFHECCELLLSEINDKLNEFMPENQVEILIHKQIRTIENLYFKKVNNNQGVKYNY